MSQRRLEYPLKWGLFPKWHAALMDAMDLADDPVV